MKTIFVGIMSAALLVGLGGSAVAYRLASASHPSSSAVATTPQPATVRAHHPRTAPARAPAPRVRVRWAPCAKSATLDHGACVTTVVHTVVVPSAPAAAAPVAQYSAPAPPRDTGSRSAAAPRGHSEAPSRSHDEPASHGEPGDGGGGDDGGGGGGGDD